MKSQLKIISNILINHMGKRYSFYLFALSIAITAIYVKNTTLHNNSRTVINGDGMAYYEFLRAGFIYNDFDYDYIFKQPNTRSEKTANTYLVRIERSIVNKAFAGTAVLIAPFFWIAHIISSCLGQQPDGLGFIFQVWVSISAIFYAFLGLWYLRKLLVRMGVKELIATLSPLFFFFGTNLFYYATSEPAYSHVYSFFIISLLLYLFNEFEQEITLLRFLIFVFLFSLLVIIRPTNGIIAIALPFVNKDITSFLSILKRIFSDWKYLFFGVIIALLVVLIQLYVYYRQTGSWIVWSYTGEGFNWNKPQIINSLFSYNRGLFIYTPLSFLALFGILPMAMNRQWVRISAFVLTFGLAVYILSSWHAWAYGSCFGLRAYIEFYPLFILLFAWLWMGVYKARYFSIFLIVTVLFLTFIYQVQNIQYRRFILHWDVMNKERYQKVFLKTQSRYGGYFYKNWIASSLKQINELNVSTDFTSTENQKWVFDKHKLITDKVKKYYPISPNDKGLRFEYSIGELKKGDMTFCIVSLSGRSNFRKPDGYVQMEVTDRDDKLILFHTSYFKDYFRGDGHFKVKFDELEMPKHGTKLKMVVGTNKNDYQLDSLSVDFKTFLK